MQKPTAKQAANRMHDGHYKALCNLRDGLPMFGPGNARTDGMVRGAMKVQQTLHRWGAITRTEENGTEITDFGRELIGAWHAKWGRDNG